MNHQEVHDLLSQPPPTRPYVPSVLQVKECLHCHQPHVKPSNFCSATCKTRWIKSMEGWANRMARTTISGQQEAAF